MCEKIQRSIQKCLQSLFLRWGKFLGRKKWHVFVIALLFLLPVSLGWMLRSEFPIQQHSWSPDNSETLSNYNTIQDLELSQSSIASFIYKAKNNENVLTKFHIGKILDFHSHLLNYNNGNFPNVECIKAGQRCLYIAHPVQFFEDINGVVDYSSIINDSQLLSKINTGRNALLNYDIRVGDIFGNTIPEDPQFNGSSYNYQSAEGIKFTYLLREEQEFTNYAQEVVKSFLSLPGNEQVRLQVWTADLFEQAMLDAISNDLIIINISVFLIVVYSLIVLGTCTPIGCRSAAAAIGVLCTMLAFVSSYGLCCCFGLHVSGIHNLLPFLLLGIGADDMYVITAVADQINPLMTMSNRMGKTLKLAGVSILITSLTDCIAFLVSSISHLPALNSFCIFAGLGIFFDFLFEITVFSAFLTYDLDRQSRNKGDCCGLCRCKQSTWICCCGKLRAKDDFDCKTAKVSITPENLKHRVQSQIMTLKNNDISFIQSQNVIEDSLAVIPKSQEKKGSSQYPQEDLDDDKLYQRSSFIQKCLSLHYSKFITRKPVQICVLIFFAGLTAFAAWGSTQIVASFQVQNFINDDHPLKQFYKLKDELFSDSGEKADYFSDATADLISENGQNKFFNAIEQLKKSEYVVDGTLSSWYLSFLSFIDSNACTACSPASACKTGNIVKNAYIGPCLHQFFSSSSGSSLVGSKVSFRMNPSNTAVTSIVASQSNYVIKKTYNGLDGVNTMKELRRIIKEFGPFGTFVYSEIFFIWEPYDNFTFSVAFSLLGALVAIFVIVLVFSGNICTTLLVVLNMGLVELNLLAMIWYWNLELNFITVINLILAIGLAVDYSAHIAHTYNVTVSDYDCVTRRERRISKVRKTFSKIGNSVFHGAVSTFLAIVTISASTSYIFRAFFKQWFCIIVFGMLHGFMLLPVLLTLFGPLTKTSVVAPFDPKDKK